MALPLTIDKLDELPEVVREHYVERNGKWTLETDADPRLTTARKESAEERRKRQELEKETQTLKQQLEELSKARQREDTNEETANQRYQRLRMEADERERRDADALRDRDSKLARLHEDLMRERISNQIRSATQKIPAFRVHAIDDAVAAGLTVFRHDEQNKLAAFDSSNERWFGRSGEDLTIEEWLGDRRTDKPHWFDGVASSGNQGGGAAHQNSTAATRARPKQRSAMSAQEKSAAIRELGIEGFMEIPE